MSSKQFDGIRLILSKWLAKETRGFIGGLAGGLIGGLSAFAAISYFCKASTVATSSDAISIANTYIVFTTFVIAAVALVLTVAGLIFTQHFALQKEQHMQHAFESMLRVLAENDDKAEKLIEHVMDNSAVQDKVSEKLEVKIKEILQQKRAQAKSTLSKAVEEANGLDDLNGDLS